MLRCLLVVVLLAGCGASAGPAAGELPQATAGGADAERGEPASASPSEASGRATPGRSAPTTFETPVKACGALESYRAVSEWRCPDGSMPLGGDPAAGRRARLGSSRSHDPDASSDPLNAHIVDIYEVPCPSGDVTVHVCLYHCPPGRTPYD